MRFSNSLHRWVGAMGLPSSEAARETRSASKWLQGRLGVNMEGSACWFRPAAPKAVAAAAPTPVYVVVNMDSVLPRTGQNVSSGT